MHLPSYHTPSPSARPGAAPRVADPGVRCHANSKKVPPPTNHSASKPECFGFPAPRPGVATNVKLPAALEHRLGDGGVSQSRPGGRHEALQDGLSMRRSPPPPPTPGRRGPPFPNSLFENKVSGKNASLSNPQHMYKRNSRHGGDGWGRQKPSPPAAQRARRQALEGKLGEEDASEGPWSVCLIRARYRVCDRFQLPFL